MIVERWFRGRHIGIKDMSVTAYKPDYTLIPKHEEQKYLDALANFTPPPPRILPNTVVMPPLLKVRKESLKLCSRYLITYCNSARNFVFLTNNTKGSV